VENVFGIDFISTSFLRLQHGNWYDGFWMGYWNAGVVVGGWSKQKNNSFRREKKEINHCSYSFRFANLNKASSARNKATKQKVSKNTHTAFPKYGKKTGERQKSTCTT